MEPGKAVGELLAGEGKEGHRAEFLTDGGCHHSGNGHGAFHVGRKLDVLEADGFDVDSPFVGLVIDDFLELFGDFVAFAEEFIEFEVAGYVAESGGGKISSCDVVVGDFEDGFSGVEDAHIDNRVNFYRNIVFCNDFLGRDVAGVGADIDFDKFFDIGENEAETGFYGAGVVAEGEDDATFVLFDDVEGREDKEDEDDD